MPNLATTAAQTQAALCVSLCNGNPWGDHVLPAIYRRVMEGRAAR
jgi:hypothetical protein